MSALQQPFLSYLYACFFYIIILIHNIFRPSAKGHPGIFCFLFPAGEGYFRDFVSSPACALLKIEVETYYVVSKLQKVEQLHMR
jgi:hypothetical protein